MVKRQLAEDMKNVGVARSVIHSCSTRYMMLHATSILHERIIRTIVRAFGVKSTALGQLFCPIKLT